MSQETIEKEIDKLLRLWSVTDDKYLQRIFYVELQHMRGLLNNGT